MASFPSEFEAHLASGLTTVCRCWLVTRADGEVHGFTDHDVDLEFEAMVFRANTGMSAAALQQSTGLSVDNSEAMGALSDSAIHEADIRAGRYDGAEVRAWLVNWAAPDQRIMQFRGTLGELKRSGGAFHAELRGLAETLNQPQGALYQAPCPAVLGDGRCQFDFSVPGYAVEIAVEAITNAKWLTFSELGEFDDRWFERGRIRVLSGAGSGLIGIVKNDRLSATGRKIELWEALRADVVVGDMIRIEAGCDKRVETCQLKFNNILNFRGFPSIPGDDWQMAVPSRQAVSSGGGSFGLLTGGA